MDPEIAKIIAEHDLRIKKLEDLVTSPTPTIKTGKEISIVEFIQKKNPKSQSDKLTLIGYFLEKNLGYSTFTRSELEEGFLRAKEPLPGNIRDTIRNNIKRGFLMVSKDKKNKYDAYVLTDTGEKAVEADFN